jgi:hypothetical protein
MMDVLERFPKVREPLPEPYARIHLAAYSANRRGATPASFLSQQMESWMHRQVASDIKNRQLAGATLELGAGTLNHLDYEPGVSPYDIVEPFSALYAGSSRLPRIRKVYRDIAEIPAGTVYARIISIATFEHICDLPCVVSAAGRLLARQGHLRIAIPSEGCPLWTMGWMLTTGLEFRWRYGLDYGVIMRHEHVNTAAEIESVLNHFFRQVRRRVFGLTAALSFYQFYDCSEFRPC